ncbi:MAG: NUDIX hydrolase, partial [Desulfuromonadales bacterium]|nr:NUDIX hydrolase [Desulfuromonadales bacterium]NIR34253.1 NUDIX hydrolase [Desulfuromonadales bacterium]NIS42799.1 NUDIX hydrolase [Desulfuromonadales bacterium]
MTEKSRTVHSGRIIDLKIETHRLPDGREADFEIVRHPGGAAVLPVLDDGRLVLIRQYRAPVGRMVLEIPAGKLDGGEPPERCAARELIEEVGYRARDLEKLGEMLTAVGFCDERLHIYLATNLEKVERNLEADEFIETVLMTPREAFACLERGEVADGKTQLALLLYR